MTPPDLPPRPVPRAPLTDVVPRRTLVIIAVVVALAVLGMVLALTLGDDGDSTATAGGGGGKASAKASAERRHQGGRGRAAPRRTAGVGVRADGAEAGKTPSAGASATGGSGARVGDPGAPATGRVDAHRASQGYSIGLPEGWKYESTGSAGDRFTGPDGQKLLVAWTSTPKGDPVADWKNQERYMVRSAVQDGSA